jgi:glycosyltransferase involved in cell wall biosynthesis
MVVSDASNVLSLQLSLFLFWVSSAIMFSWSYLFFVSIRSDMRSPTITYSTTTNIEKSSIENQGKCTRRINQGENVVVIGQIEKKELLQQNAASQSITLDTQCDITGDDDDDDIQTGDADNNNSFPFVSIIVPARNEQKNIESCLLSLLSQNYPCFEVIAVNDNSSDDTLKIMRKLESKILTEEQDDDIDTGTKLKVITLANKPHDWTGKTWASHQGYLHSRGDILLFTDADSHFQSTDTLRLTVSHMQQEKLDALTGLPYLPLMDFWSKIVEPLWNLFIVLGPTIPKINDPQSKQMLVMGSFFMIKKNVYESVGTYNAVKGSLQEDTAMGVRIRQSGYKLRMTKVDNLVTALLSRDLSTLWHNSIGRSIINAAVENRWNAVKNIAIITLMTLLPFLIFACVALLKLHEANDDLPLFAQSFLSSSSLTQLNVIQDNSLLSQLSHSTTLFSLSLISYLMVIGGVAVKCVKKYRQWPLFAFLAPIASVFLIIALLYHIAPIIRAGCSTIQWRGRFYMVNKNGLSSQSTTTNAHSA